MKDRVMLTVAATPPGVSLTVDPNTTTSAVYRMKITVFSLFHAVAFCPPTAI